MKKLSFFTFLLFVPLFFLLSCSGSPSEGNPSQEDPPTYDTIVEVTIDTIITFDPNTYEETVTIQKSYDTVILMDGKKVDLKVTRPLKEK